jgi:DNA-binding NarL/FixJ family response regulator
VTTHIERILHKMNQESRAGAIGAALKEGFLRIDD